MPDTEVEITDMDEQEVQRQREAVEEEGAGA